MKRTITLLIIWAVGLCAGCIVNKLVNSKKNRDIRNSYFMNLKFIDDGRLTLVKDLGQDIWRKRMPDDLQDGLIPDAKAAVNYAQPFFFKVLGFKSTYMSQPYKVSLVNDTIWEIETTHPKNVEGGTNCIYISKRDGHFIWTFFQK